MSEYDFDAYECSSFIGQRRSKTSGASHMVVSFLMGVLENELGSSVRVVQALYSRLSSLGSLYFNW